LVALALEFDCAFSTSSVATHLPLHSTFHSRNVPSADALATWRAISHAATLPGGEGSVAGGTQQSARTDEECPLKTMGWGEKFIK
jgi:hypothetical protein